MSRRAYAAGALVCIAAAIAFLGNYHVVWGTLDRLHLEPKVSWSLSETFINTDEITGTPALLRSARFPLYFQALVAAEKRERNSKR